MARQIKLNTFVNVEDEEQFRAHCLKKLQEQEPNRDFSTYSLDEIAAFYFDPIPDFPVECPAGATVSVYSSRY